MRLGLFDSGIGGFTVLKKVVELFPNTSFIYLADVVSGFSIINLSDILLSFLKISTWVEGVVAITIESKFVSKENK